MPLYSLSQSLQSQHRSGLLRYSSAITAASLLFSGSYAAAQETDPDLEEIVIGALRLPTPISETGTAVSIITADTIDDLGVDFVLDALTLAPGVTINQNGAFGGLASVRIRGASSEQTLVLVDGIAVNDPTSPGGGFNFARLDTENVARIEILRGPQSTLWGTDAIGGVVSITTKGPQDGLSGNAFIEGGSFGTFRGGLSGSVANDIGDLRLAATGITSNGISKADEINGNTEDDAFDSGTLSANGGLNLPADIRLAGSILYNRADAEFDSFSGGAQGSVADGDELSETEEIAANVSLLVPLFDGRFENLFLVGYSTIDRRNLSDGVESFAADGERLILRYQGSFALSDMQRLLFGYERDRTEAGDDDTAINGFFGVYELQPIDSITLSAGVRHDDHERFGGETTFRAAAAFQVTDQINLRGSYGEGFKAPTLFQTTFFCCGATAPNADLLPERSKGFDVGVDYTLPDGLGGLSATYFNQNITDQIDFSFAVGGYLNVDEVDTQGLELAGELKPSERLQFNFNYTLIDAKEGDGSERLRVPRRSGTISATVRPIEKLSTTIIARYNGDELDRGGIVEEWFRVDLSGQYQINDKVEAFARVENLFDEQYQQILGYGTPGLSGYIGVRLRL
ncbi:MAG: TonB-dependent receptor [Pseudomonadota bacterium]